MRGLLGGAVALILVAATPVGADPLAPAKDPDPGAAPSHPSPPPPPAVDEGTSHRGMLEVSLQLPLGLRAIVPYDKADYCGKKDSSSSTGNAPVCSGRSPFSIDLALGYGVQRRIDLFAEVRLGIQGDFGPTALSSNEGPRQFHVSPGVRFFFSDARSTKLFTTAQLVFDFAGYKDPSGTDRGVDLGVRNINGLWLDLEKAYGFYVFVGDTLTLKRWLRFELEAGLGVQVRYR